VTEPPTAPDPAVHADIEKANQALYSAFEEADVDALEELWDDADDIACVHPGSPLLTGRRDVLRSWTALLANSGYLQFVLSGVNVRVEGDIAVVTCEENILADLSSARGLVGGTAVATNVFRRRGERWRLWIHHSSPVATADVSDDD
jgi:ketosteroid isomerase-like protein